jgi:hypothetical protein
MSECRHDDPEGYHIQSLWISSLIIIIIGYMTMVFYCFMLVIIAGATYTYKSWTVKPDTQEP